MTDSSKAAERPPPMFAGAGAPPLPDPLPPGAKILYQPVYVIPGNPYVYPIGGPIDGTQVVSGDFLKTCKKVGDKTQEIARPIAKGVNEFFVSTGKSIKEFFDTPAAK